MAGRARIIVTDKNPLVLTGLKALLENEAEMDVVATATDGEEFLQKIREIPCDVGVIGWEMPGKDGRGVLDILANDPAAPRIVIYTGVPGARVVREAMLHGAAGFCHKGDSNEALLEVVGAVAEGRMSFPFTDLRKIAEDPWEALTRRELELLDSLKTGRSNKQIATNMGITENTVKFHLKNLFSKLGVKNRSQAVALALTRESR
ncbi:response regulator transcription factor [Aestuariispira ectoiniformans]|uniref:response regulator transcription factor n=1 Tax=Aestuariispira ectoiniformans TaxID=2775080 RepID=UPI00223C5188|nr:response regulator transcription factor [Aestuariispira ectoiniformans]